MESSIFMKLEDVHRELETVCSAALVLTLALGSVPTNGATFVGSMELLLQAIDNIEESLSALLESVKHE